MELDKNPAAIYLFLFIFPPEMFGNVEMVNKIINKSILKKKGGGTPNVDVL